ncbi:PAS domain S-box protein [Priestia megaterium]|nr:PAS domain S-box protein [Priestia megaterium]
MAILNGDYNMFTVVLSIVVSVMSAYTALDMLERTNRGESVSYRWISMSAFSMGMGVWSLHFIGMLSVYMPVHLKFNHELTLLSFIITLAGAFVAFLAYAKFKKTVYAGLMLGSSVVIAHYIAIAAIQIDAEIHYDIVSISFSIIIGLLLAIYALRLFETQRSQHHKMIKLFSAIILGSGISGIHYIGIAGVTVTESVYLQGRFEQFVPYQESFANLLASVTVTLLILFLLVAAFKKHSEAQASMLKEASYQSLFNYNPDIVCSVNLNGYIDAMNTKGRDATDYMIHDVANIPFSSLFKTDEHDQIASFFQQSLAGKAVSYEATIVKQAGKELYVEVTQMPIIVGGVIHGVYVIAKDITNQKRAQERLHMLQEELKLTLAQQDGIILKLVKRNEQFIYTMCEGKLMKRLGCQCSDVVGLTLNEISLKTESKVKLFEYEKAWSGQEVWFEGVMKDINYYAKLTPIKKDGQVIEIIGTVTDITGLYMAQEQLAKSESMYRSVLSTMTEGLVFHDKQGEIVVANQHAANILEMTYEDFLKLNPTELEWEVIHPDGRSFEEEEIPSVKCLRTGQSSKNVVMGIHLTEKKLIWLSINAQPLSQSDYYEGVVVTFTDITKQRQQESELIRFNQELTLAKEEAEKANKAKTDFLSKVSHELRTPLNSILGYAQILADQGNEHLSPKQLERIDKISTAGKHLLHLINETLDLSKIEAGHLALNIQPVSINKAIEEAIKTMKPLAENRYLFLKVYSETNQDVFIEVDELRFQQILLNLLTNAVKYSHPHKEVKVRVINHDHDVIIRVSDEGVGIAESELHNIFEPFYRSHTLVKEGTGIGLALVKQLVTLMNGTYGVSSTEGKGSTFWVTFPKSKSKQKASIKADNDSVYQHKALTDVVDLVYVEDNDENVELMRAVFAKYGAIKLHVAKNGLSGLELIRTVRPHLILIDMDLPDITGVELCKKIKEHTDLTQIPLIAISANAMQQDIDKALVSGFEEYVTKPIHIESFFLLLQRILDKKV